MTIYHRKLNGGAALAVAVLVLALPLLARADASSSPDAAVTTGDASAEAQSETAANEDDLTGAASTTLEDVATTTSETAAVAETGGNSASSTAGDAAVETGDAYASANSVNVVNANIVDSAGLLVFSDLFSSLGIDLRQLDLSYFSQSPGDCSGCDDLSTEAQNAATTTSIVTAVAETGGNSASSTAGDAAVETGDAYASANSVNVVNSTLVRSNYLLVAVNDFGDLAGNIVLPGAAFFEDLLAHSRANASASSADNTAVVSDGTSAVAETGGNSASSTAGDAAVETGDARASATSFNLVNSTLTGGSSVYLLFRIWGDWSGTVEGLPPGLSWLDTPQGITIVSDDGAPAALPAGGASTASATDTAALDNQVSVYALTGENEAAGASASVKTGDAYASANSINIVNTNILGANWILAIFNIFGNFSGDISFGEPDLWLGAAAETSNPTLPGSPVTFRFTVANRGDAAATGVRLSAVYQAGMLAFAEGAPQEGGTAFDLGTIPAGATEEFSYTAAAGDVPAGDSIAVPLTATLTEDETDANDADNADSLTIVVMTPGPGSQEGPSFSSDPAILIHKLADPASALAPASVDYRTQIYNDGGPAFGATARETLTGPDGSVLRQKRWDLGTLGYQDGVDLSYTIDYATDTPPGLYTDVVEIAGAKHYPLGNAGSVPIVPVWATTTVMVGAPPAPAPAALSCARYLTTYIAPGDENDEASVKKLQEFLRDHEGEDLAVTGLYDDATRAAVERFQEKYAADILAPWGYDAPTGLVYYTTQKEINDLACGGAHSFELSGAQRAEIEATRALLAVPPPAPAAPAPPASSTPPAALPPGVRVGVAAPAPREAAQPSWWERFMGARSSLIANVLEALASPQARAAER